VLVEGEPNNKMQSHDISFAAGDVRGGNFVLYHVYLSSGLPKGTTGCPARFESGALSDCLRLPVIVTLDLSLNSRLVASARSSIQTALELLNPFNFFIHCGSLGSLLRNIAYLICFTSTWLYFQFQFLDDDSPISIFVVIVPYRCRGYLKRIKKMQLLRYDGLRRLRLFTPATNTSFSQPLPIQCLCNRRGVSIDSLAGLLLSFLVTNGIFLVQLAYRNLPVALSPVILT